MFMYCWVAIVGVFRDCFFTLANIIYFEFLGWKMDVKI